VSVSCLASERLTFEGWIVCPGRDFEVREIPEYVIVKVEHQVSFEL
jgi:hypothetical protein